MRSTLPPRLEWQALFAKGKEQEAVAHAAFALAKVQRGGHLQQPKTRAEWWCQNADELFDPAR